MALQIQRENNAELEVEAEPAKNQTWEKNRAVITKAICVLIYQNQRMPTKAEIAKETGLSRQTIHQHMKQLGNDPLLAEQLEVFRLTASRMLAKVFQVAMGGDVRAARLSLEIMGILKNQNSNNNIIKTDNVNIQNA